MRRRFGRALEPVIAALVAKVLEHRTVVLFAGRAQLDPVQVHIAADHGRRDGNGLLLQAQKGLQFLAGTSGVFGGDHADHLKHIGFQAHGAHIGHHGSGHGLVAGQRTELVHLVFQQKWILATAFQQRSSRAVRQ